MLGGGDMNFSMQGVVCSRGILNLEESQFVEQVGPSLPFTGGVALLLSSRLLTKSTAMRNISFKE
jgi:hypothetical protein